MRYIVTVHIDETRSGAVDVCVEAADAASAQKMARAQCSKGSFFNTTCTPTRRLIAEVPRVLELTPTDLRGIEALLDAMPADTFIDLTTDVVHYRIEFPEDLDHLVKEQLGLRHEFAPLVVEVLRTMELPAGWRRTNRYLLKTDTKVAQ
jgi:hypothetical protein